MTTQHDPAVLAVSHREHRPAVPGLRGFGSACLALLRHLASDRQRRIERSVIARYEGDAWCDSTERKLNDDIVKATWLRS
jgi:hypothetical protein